MTDARFGWWSPADLIVRITMAPTNKQPREEWVAERRRYPWRWLAHIWNPSGSHMRVILGRVTFLSFEVVPAGFAPAHHATPSKDTPA